MISKEYWDRVRGIIDQLMEKQASEIKKAAQIVADTIIGGGKVWAFGATHSAIMVQELVYRAGGLIPINPLFAPGLDVSIRPVTLSSKLERLSGLGSLLVDENQIGTGDCLFVFSTSGRNPVPIDVALTAKSRGAKVIAIVSVEYASAVKSRHPLGRNLHELDLDVILDNGAPTGDALMEIKSDTDFVMAGPVSTISSCVLVDAIVVETAQIVGVEREKIPVFLSGNLEQGDKHNKEMINRHRDQIKYI